MPSPAMRHLFLLDSISAIDPIHAGQVIVADGTDAAARRLERVLTSDPGMGVARHADAGYAEAIDFARHHGVKLPMVTT